jgi:hypothetical protein
MAIFKSSYQARVNNSRIFCQGQIELFKCYCWSQFILGCQRESLLFRPQNFGYFEVKYHRRYRKRENLSSEVTDKKLIIVYVAYVLAT